MAKQMKQPAIRSRRALAMALGVTRHQVDGAAADPGWPFGPAPWDAGKLDDIRQHLADRAAQLRPSNPVKEARQQLLREQLQLLDLLNAIARGELVHERTLANRVNSAVVKCRTSVLAIPSRIVPVIGNVEEVISTTIEDAINEIEKDINTVFEEARAAAKAAADAPDTDDVIADARRSTSGRAAGKGRADADRAPKARGGTHAN